MGAENPSGDNKMAEEKVKKVTNEDLFNALVVLDQKMNMILSVFNKIQAKIEEAEKETDISEEVQN